MYVFCNSLLKLCKGFFVDNKYFYFFPVLVTFMKRKTLLLCLLSVIVMVLILKLSTTLLVEPWLEKRLETLFNEKSEKYQLEVGHIHLRFLSSEIKLDSLLLINKVDNDRKLSGRVTAVRIQGINLFRLLFQKNIAIRKLSISEISIFGQLPHSEKKALPQIMPMNLRIGRIVLKKIDFGLEEPALTKAYNLQSGALIMYDLKIEKRDTLSIHLIKRVDFKADGFQTLSKDSMYTYKLKGVDYKCKPGKLSVKEVVIHPNYSKKRFAELHRFATDRMDGRFSNIVAGGFSVEDLIKSKRLGSSGIEVDSLNLIIFRDNRIEKRHVVKPVFQEMIYHCPVSLNLDSIHVKNGDITYVERVPQANHQGSICFNQINATLYNITNDTRYKKRNVSLILKGTALLMGKGRFNVLLKAKLYDRLNTFTVKANLSHISASSLNPLLSNNVFMRIASGEIESMNFFFTANDLKAKGSMCLLYHDLKIAVLNKETDKSNALKERFLSMVLNFKILNSNPLLGKEVRVGKIEYDRNPEKFLFSYCVKSIVSGIQTSIL